MLLVLFVLFVLFVLLLVLLPLILTCATGHKLCALDAKGEWFIDQAGQPPSNWTAYVKMPDDAPPADRFAIKVREGPGQAAGQHTRPASPTQQLLPLLRLHAWTVICSALLCACR